MVRTFRDELTPLDKACLLKFVKHHHQGDEAIFPYEDFLYIEKTTEYRVYKLLLKTGRWN